MTYADDITITSTHTSTSAAKKYIQPYLHKVFAWEKQNNLLLNPDKTTCTLFTPDPAEQTNLPSSNHTYTKSTPKHIHHHYAPSVTSTHTTHIISSTAPTYAPHCRPWICGTDPAGVTALLARWTEKLAGGPQAGTSDSPH